MGERLLGQHKLTRSTLEEDPTGEMPVGGMQPVTCIAKISQTLKGALKFPIVPITEHTQSTSVKTDTDVSVTSSHTCMKPCSCDRVVKASEPNKVPLSACTILKL